jgi:hypothetical protein
MFKVIVAPSYVTTKNKISLFLGGGISNCPDWREVIIEKIKLNNNPYDKKMFDDLVIFNPRRKVYPKGDKLKEQVIWEFEKLKDSNIIVFWFSEGSTNPITLFEYGKYLPTSVKLVVGIDKGYIRKSDVEIQTNLVRTNQNISYNLDDLYKEIISATYEEQLRQNRL